MRIVIPDTMKYFCVSESIAYYLQKYVVFRKRKIFHGKQKFSELVDVIKKHKTETFLLPCSDIHKQDIPKQLDDIKVKYNKAVIYRTVASDMSDIPNLHEAYDMLIFFSPSGIISLYKNFPDYQQGDMHIAAMGPSTAKSALDAGLRLDLQAPMPEAPSMTAALEQYLKKINKK